MRINYYKVLLICCPYRYFCSKLKRVASLRPLCWWADRARHNNVNPGPHLCWCLPQHCAQLDVPSSGWGKRVILEACHWESCKEAERETWWVRQLDHSHYHQWSSPQQVCHHTAHTGWQIAGNMPLSHRASRPTARFCSAGTISITADLVLVNLWWSRASVIIDWSIC